MKSRKQKNLEFCPTYISKNLFLVENLQRRGGERAGYEGGLGTAGLINYDEPRGVVGMSGVSYL